MWSPRQRPLLLEFQLHRSYKNLFGTHFQARCSPLSILDLCRVSHLHQMSETPPRRRSPGTSLSAAIQLPRSSFGRKPTNKPTHKTELCLHRQRSHHRQQTTAFKAGAQREDLTCKHVCPENTRIASLGFAPASRGPAPGTRRREREGLPLRFLANAPAVVTAARWS